MRSQSKGSSKVRHMSLLQSLGRVADVDVGRGVIGQGTAAHPAGEFRRENARGSDPACPLPRPTVEAWNFAPILRLGDSARPAQFSR